MAKQDDAEERLRARIEGPGVPEHLARLIGKEMRSRTVFGKPVAVGGVKVIPVAKARWGFGGGSGGEGEQHGSGGGGGAHVVPVGFIEIRETGATFKPIRDPRLVGLGVAAVVGAVALVVARLLGRR